MKKYNEIMKHQSSMSGTSETSMSSRDSFSTNSSKDKINLKDKKKGTDAFLVPEETPLASYGYTRKQLYMEDRTKI